MNKIIKLVKQADADCVLACIAMVACKTLQDIYDTFPEFDECYGVTDDEKIDILSELEIVCIEYETKILVPGRVYIVGVPSLNVLGGTHCIVVDTRINFEAKIKVYDPNKGNEGMKHYTAKSFEKIELISVIEIV